MQKPSEQKAESQPAGDDKPETPKSSTLDAKIPKKATALDMKIPKKPGISAMKIPKKEGYVPPALPEKKPKKGRHILQQSIELSLPGH